ncbi:hypothetical protein QUB05_18110 [Microcoleus sp. F10-C6]|uniref:hypothetical protein n=1 Tax=unclassified Microcoleus TaxID=2642155 RepID=UPI002FCFBD0C
MKYLLDTDRLSILQRQAGRDFSNLSTRMAQYPLSEFQTARKICYYWDIEFEDAYDTDNRG